MPFPLLLPLAIGAAQAIPKFLAAAKQKKQANRLTLQDTTPGASKEQLAGLRLGANTARLPGMGAAENKLAQNFAAGAGAATRAGGSSADVLASINALSLNRQAGQNQLTTQGLNYQDVAKQRLNVGLGQQAGYQRADQEKFERSKAALIQSSNQNLMNGIDGIAGFAAMGVNGMMGGTPAPALNGLDALNYGGGYVPQSGVGLSNYTTRRKQRGIGLY